LLGKKGYVVVVVINTMGRLFSRFMDNKHWSSSRGKEKNIIFSPLSILAWNSFSEHE